MCSHKIARGGALSLGTATDLNDDIRIESPPTQRVLVTGATGFIGARLVERLIESRHHVTCLVRDDTRARPLNAAGAELVTGDVTDHPSIQRAMVQSQADVVYHLAGLVRSVRSMDFMKVNEVGSANLAGVCAGSLPGRAAPPVLVVVSSLAAAGPSTADRPRVESDIAAPVSQYGRSKLAGERAAALFAAAMPITIVRPTIVFGPGDRAVLEMFRPIARRGLHVVPGPRGADRRFSLVHVDDLIHCLLQAAAHGERLPAGDAEHGEGQGIYHLAGDEQPTYVELGQAMASALGRKPPTIVHVPAWLMRFTGRMGDLVASIRRRPGWISRDKITEALAGSWTCSSDKARTQLGWAPSRPLMERLIETVTWYRAARWL